MPDLSAETGFFESKKPGASFEVLRCFQWMTAPGRDTGREPVVISRHFIPLPPIPLPKIPAAALAGIRRPKLDRRKLAPRLGSADWSRAGWQGIGGRGMAIHRKQRGTFLLRRAVGHRTGLCRNLGDPAAIVFLFGFHFHGGTVVVRCGPGKRGFCRAALDTNRRNA